MVIMTLLDVEISTICMLSPNFPLEYSSSMTLPIWYTSFVFKHKPENLSYEN